MLVHVELSSPWDGCKLVHRNGIQCRFGLVNWVHHKFVDMSVYGQLMGTVLRINLVLVVVGSLIGLVDGFLVILVLLGANYA